MALVDTSGRFAVVHGGSRTREYGIWGNMLYRCNTPTSAHYPAYGGRGIKVCEHWHNFENFLADMGPAHSTEMTVERVDVNGDYEPGNCRWATPKEQAQNRRNTRRVTFNGETKSLATWVADLGLSWHAVSNRYRRGWPPERMFSPVQEKRKC